MGRVPDIFRPTGSDEKGLSSWAFLLVFINFFKEIIFGLLYRLKHINGDAHER